MYLAADKLAHILIACIDEDLRSVASRPGGDATDRVIRLHPLDAERGNPCEIAKGKRLVYLGEEIFRHPLAVALVFAVEGRAPPFVIGPIEDRDQMVGRKIFYQLVDRTDKAIEGAGGFPLRVS